MDSQLSGNRYELLFIETEHIYFTIKGNSSSVGYGNEKSLTVIINGRKEINNINQYIYFKEYTNYEVIIERKDKINIEFYHENINIRNKVTPTGRTGNLHSGIINFRGDIGYSNLYVNVNGKVHLKLTIEVLPSKLDYREDYISILSDVNKEIYNLAYGLLGRTYLGMEINNKASNSYSEFYSILNYVYEKLIRSINLVIFNPHHELGKDSRVCKYHSLKNINNETVKWLEKRPHLIKKVGDSYIPVEALQVTKKVTYDTKENRFLKFMLTKITEKIKHFIKLYTSTPYKYDKDVVNKLKSMEREITRRLRTSLLKNVNIDYRNTDISLVFIMGSGYKEIYKYYLILQKGLNINSNILSLSMKELSLLYEYWCFIKINSLLMEKYRLITADFMKINRNGIVVSLKKGVSSTLKYENRITKERFQVSYNSKKLSKTIAQKPDNILQIYKEGNDKAYEFIFDAKYKIETDSVYRRQYGGVGPKEEDINTMHRYRDAIVYSNKEEASYKNCIFGAFVLFPYKNEEEYRKHDFYKSIEEVNIGGLPFLPSSTSLMKEFLDKLINESSYSSFERSLETIGQENYFKDEWFNNRTVLVGSLRNKEQLAVNLKYNFYHTACKNINLVERNVKFVALAQSKNSFQGDAGIKYYGAVKNIRTVKRREIKEIPKDSEEDYYIIEVDAWKELERKIKVSGYQVIKILYTTEFLLKNARIVTELCIKSKEEFRLWQELRRINSNIYTKGEKLIGNDSKINGFSIDGIDIVVTEDKILVGNDGATFSIADFNKRPRVIMQEIMKLIK